MYRRFSCIALAMLMAAVALTGPAQALEVRVNLAPLGRSYSPPPLGRKQGWLTISNRDWQPYSVVVTGKDRIYVYRSAGGHGGVVIPSGATMTLALEKDTYDLYGNSSEKLKVRVREGRTTTLSLEPFGYAGSTGLTAIANDGERVRSAAIFDSRPHVVVAPPRRPVVVAPPPPPPVIITRPPAHRPPPPRPHPPGRPGPAVKPGPGRPGGHTPPPPPKKDKKDGWSIVVGVGKR